MNVVLIGFMATGKSTTGRALGRMIDAPFLDMDGVLRRQFGMTIPEVFAEHGEAAFRDAEHRLLRELIAEQTLPPSAPRRFPYRYVLSTGGGVPLREENRPLLAKIGHVVWLRAKIETIAGRCRPHFDRRPLLHGHEEDLEEHIAGLLAIREPIYEATAQAAVWTDEDSDPEVIARRIKSAVGYPERRSVNAQPQAKRS